MSTLTTTICRRWLVTGTVRFRVRQRGGLYPTEEILQTLYADRHENKQAILDTLHGTAQLATTWVTMLTIQGWIVNWITVCRYTWLVVRRSVKPSVEDWLEMDKPVNIPGTFDEYPNWRRKLTENIESIFDRHDINELASKLTLPESKSRLITIIE